MKYFLIAGEASGDLHASNLMRGLLKHDPGASFRYLGGDLMGEVSGERVLHYRETNYMMLDVLLHLRKVFRNMARIRREIIRWDPDVVIPVDYPGFNLRIARYASKKGFRVFYFISPKVWAWKQRRVVTLKRYTDRLFTILPFETSFFARFGLETEYFGNPLVDLVEDFRSRFEGAEAWKRRHGMGDRRLVALLAGSRRKEVEAMLPLMASLAPQHPGYQFVVAGTGSVEKSLYERLLKGTGVGIVYGETYPLLASSEAGMITSGTATLEAALFRLPHVVLYRTGSAAYALAKRIIKVNFISLVNLVYGEELVKEIIQKDMKKRTERELAGILGDTGYRDRMVGGFRALRSQLGDGEVTSKISARMVELLRAEEA